MLFEIIPKTGGFSFVKKKKKKIKTQDLGRMF